MYNDNDSRMRAAVSYNLHHPLRRSGFTNSVYIKDSKTDTSGEVSVF